MPSLIRNYGLFWKAEAVFWGRPSVSGTLIGRNADRVTDSPVDFREQQGVYVLYDDNFSILYVGQAGYGNKRLFHRLRDHRKGPLAERWSRFSWFGLCEVRDNALLETAAIQDVPVRTVLDHIEAVLISAAEPPHNRQGGRFGPDASPYLQERDPNLGPTPQEMIRQLWDDSQRSD